MATNDAPKQQRQQLSKGMEHIRYAVTIDPAFRPKQTQSSSHSSTSSLPNLLQPLGASPKVRRFAIAAHLSLPVCIAEEEAATSPRQHSTPCLRSLTS